MTRIGFDAIYADKLPAHGDIYLGYDDGNWADFQAIQQRFGGVLVEPITVDPKDNKGRIGDGPPDNGSWPEWVAWVVMRRNSGEDWPVINTDDALWGAGIAAFRGAGVPEPLWWIAKYDGVPVVPKGAVGKQYLSNQDYDTSVFLDYWPGVDPALQPIPVPQPLEDEDMARLYICPRDAGTTATLDVFKLEDGQYLHVPDGADYAALQRAGLTSVQITYAMHVAQLKAYGGTPVVVVAAAPAVE